MKNVIIYTDGGCRGNPGPGGWGAVLTYGNHQRSIKGFKQDTTNNQMELMAAIKALQSLTQECQIDLYTDSVYVRNGITDWMDNWKRKNWRTANKKPVKNKQLWQDLDAQNIRHQVTWHWVKGHAGNEGNEAADALANMAMDEGMSIIKAPT